MRRSAHFDVDEDPLRPAALIACFFLMSCGSSSSSAPCAFIGALERCASKYLGCGDRQCLIDAATCEADAYGSVPGLTCHVYVEQAFIACLKAAVSEWNIDHCRLVRAEADCPGENDMMCPSADAG